MKTKPKLRLVIPNNGEQKIVQDNLIKVVAENLWNNEEFRTYLMTNEVSKESNKKHIV